MSSRVPGRVQPPVAPRCGGDTLGTPSPQTASVPEVPPAEALLQAAVPGPLVLSVTRAWLLHGGRGARKLWLSQSLQTCWVRRCSSFLDFSPSSLPNLIFLWYTRRVTGGLA